MTMPASTEGRNEKRPLHVALLTGYIPPYQAPVYRALADSLQRLSLLVSTPMEHDRVWDAEWEGLDVTQQSTWSCRRTTRADETRSEPGAIHFPIDTWRQLGRLQPDVVISEELGFRSILCVAGRLVRQELPLILICNLSEHTEQHRGGLRRLVRRLLLKNCSAVTVNGNSGARYIESLNVPRAKIFRFPYAAVSKPFLSLELDRSTSAEHRIVYCGSINHRKGMLPMLTALAAWATRNPLSRAELTIIGDGPLAAQLETSRLPKNLKLNLLGHLSYEQIAEVYQQQSVFIFPTMADEWGLVVNEALAAGLPVLGSVYSQAVVDLVTPENGWQFHPDDPDDFARSLDDCLSTSPVRMLAMRNSARASIIQRTPHWAASQLLDAIDAVVECK